ncbi:hypothetical protein BDW59DRAFT_151569 [Aspergillus cavernicola]|uniref:Uncharacterized protein n=1 Tax=Aspergillus cavernicola TaxID=176166 RepID=A0ABR4HV52_9EURO
MPEASKPDPKEGLMERMFHRNPSFDQAQDQDKPKVSPEHLENQSHEDRPPHHQRRDSKLQRFKNYLKSEDELDEAAKTYAKLL